MSGSKSSNTGSKKAQNTEQEGEVLYQKLGEQWFAFSIVNDEVFMSPVTAETIQEVKNEAAQN